MNERYVIPGGEARKRMQDNAGEEADRLMDEAMKLASTLGRNNRAEFVPYTPAEVLNCYDGGKRKIYTHVFERLKYTKVFNIKWSNVRPFVKNEKYTYYDKIDRIPRQIMPPRKEYLAIMAQYIKPIERRLKQIVLPGCMFPFLAKGMSNKDLAIRFKAMWACFKEPVALSLDLSKFDSTIQPALKRLENNFFRKFSRDKWFNYCLDVQEQETQVVVLDDGPMKIPRGRNSGDAHTGAGNSLIMAIVSRVIVDVRAEFYVNGDDTVILFEKEHLSYIRGKITDDFAKFGLSLKEEACDTNLYEVRWCQCRFTQTPVGDRWIRDYERVLNTIFSNVEYTPTKVRGLLPQIAYAEMVQNPGVPIIAPICDFITRMFKPRGNWHNKQDTLYRLKYLPKSDAKYIQPDTLSRQRFFDVTHITPVEQVKIEKKIMDKLLTMRLSVLETTWSTHRIHPHF